MSTKTTVLLAALIPGLALLTACNRNVDDTTPTPTAETAPAPAPAPAATDTMPPEPMPAEPAPAPADTAAPATAPAGPELPFADLDKNHDGFITREELPDTDMLAQHFSVADSDGDGKLSEAEVTKHRVDMSAAPQ